MMMQPEEIEDPEGYCLLKIEKIEAVHGCLRQNVQTGHIKPERGDYLKSKFEELREALRKKIMYERKIFADKSELAIEKEQQEKKLAQYKKEAERDRETIAIIGEDAEEADAEAVMAIERAEKAVLETEELRIMKQLYQQKIDDIKREHAIALEPVIARLQQEIKTEEEETKERAGKLDHSMKEIEDSKANHAQLIEDIRILRESRMEYEDKMENFAGLPEKLKKQVDILLNAIKAARAQVEKWTVKVGECDEQLHGGRQTIKHKKEEFAHAVVSYQKMQLHAQQQEIVARDLAKDLDHAKDDLEIHFNDQVYLDLQLMGKLLDLKHVQELHTKTLRERERALIRLQQVQQELERIKSSIPGYKQERKKAQKEFVTAEEERMKWDELVINIRREVDLTMQSLRKAEKLGDDILQLMRKCNAKVQALEKELVKCILKDRRNQNLQSDLNKTRERFSRVASLKYSLWKQTLTKVETEKGYHKGFLKRVEQCNKEHQDNILLYNNIRSQRNRFLRLVEQSNITVLEMVDKMRPIGQQVENLRDDVTYKIKVFDKLHQHCLDSIKTSGYVKADISKCHGVLVEKKFALHELKMERKKLEEFLQKKLHIQKKTRSEYAIHIRDRNACGLNLIDRNDELSILYEKVNVQADLMKFSELELLKRLAEITLLRNACRNVAYDIATEKRSAPDPTSLFVEFTTLKKKVSTAKATLEQLSDLCENPLEKTKRWRQLKGHEHKAMDLERKAWATQVYINEKESQAIEKDIILKELSALLKSAMRQGALKVMTGTELSRKRNESVRQRMTTSRALVATISELALVQGRAMAMKLEKEEAFDKLNEAQLRLAVGVPPTEEAEREFAFMEREAAVARKIELQRQALQQEEKNYKEAQHCTHTGRRPKTTPNITSRAARRPNAYLGGPFGLPVPFPVHLPFRPSTQGSVMRHVRKQSSASTAGSMSLVAIKS